MAGVTTSANKIIYSTAADTFTTADLSAYGRSLIDDADAATARTTLGLGTAATQASGAFAAASHSHVIADVTGLQAAIDGKAAVSHAHVIGDVTGLQDDLDAIADALAGTAAAVHGHAIADVTGLQTALDGKSAVGHGHVIADVTGLQTAIDGKQPLDATLTAFAALTMSANKIVYATGPDAFALADLTAFARSLLDDADAATVRGNLGPRYGRDPGERCFCGGVAQPRDR
ncbi:MAG: hypothetical protein IPK59_10230 [Rhodospirillaceae bacterium]|nr:hypothetical protein [Rhodospirillaceae bacterium]